MKRIHRVKGNFFAILLVLMAAALLMPGYGLAGKESKKKAKAKSDAAGENKDAARKHFKKGVKLFKDEDYSKALQSFLASNELFPHPKTLLNIANCYEKLFELPDAMKYYTEFLEKGGSDITASEKKDVDSKMDRMKDKVGLVEVGGDIKGELIVDGKSITKLPSKEKIYVYSGSHNVMIKSEGKIVFSEDVGIPGGGTKKIAVAAKPEKKPGEEPTPLPVEKGKGAGNGEGKEEEKEDIRGLLHVSSTIEGSDVVVNDKKVGSSPWEEELKEGMYDLKISYEGFPSWQKIVEVEPEKTTFVDVDLKATKKKAAPWWWITAGAAVACTGLWAGFGIDGIKAKKDAGDMDPDDDPECAADEACYNRYNDLVDRAKRDFIVADITGPLALVFIGGSVALFLLVKKEKNIPKAHIEVSSISPFLTPDGSAGGLGITGNF